jgi:hypothetical protein
MRARCARRSPGRPVPRHRRAVRDTRREQLVVVAERRWWRPQPRKTRREIIECRALWARAAAGQDRDRASVMRSGDQGAANGQRDLPNSPCSRASINTSRRSVWRPPRNRNAQRSWPIARRNTRARSRARVPGRERAVRPTHPACAPTAPGNGQVMRGRRSGPVDARGERPSRRRGAARSREHQRANGRATRPNGRGPSNGSA